MLAITNAKKILMGKNSNFLTVRTRNFCVYTWLALSFRAPISAFWSGGGCGGNARDFLSGLLGGSPVGFCRKMAEHQWRRSHGTTKRPGVKKRRRRRVEILRQQNTTRFLTLGQTGRKEKRGRCKVAWLAHSNRPETPSESS